MSKRKINRRMEQIEVGYEYINRKKIEQEISKYENPTESRPQRINNLINKEQNTKKLQNDGKSQIKKLNQFIGRIKSRKLSIGYPKITSIEKVFSKKDIRRVADSQGNRKTIVIQPEIVLEAVIRKISGYQFFVEIRKKEFVERNGKAEFKTFFNTIIPADYCNSAKQVFEYIMEHSTYGNQTTPIYEQLKDSKDQKKDKEDEEDTFEVLKELLNDLYDSKEVKKLNVKKLREQGYTYKEVGEQLNISKTTAYRLIN